MDKTDCLDLIFSFILCDKKRHLWTADERTRLIAFSIELYPTPSIHRKVKDRRRVWRKEKVYHPEMFSLSLFFFEDSSRFLWMEVRKSMKDSY